MRGRVGLGALGRAALLLCGALLAWAPASGRAAAALPPPAEPALAAVAGQFQEPLVPTGARPAGEDADLATAVARYRAQPSGEDLAPLEAFVARHPASAWRLAVLTNLGLSYYHYGYFAHAIEAYEQAWAAGRDATDLRARALADRAGGELLKMHARLGHADRLTALLAEMSDRGLTGPATELRDGAKEGLWMMRHNPGVAYLCGPMALKNLLLARGTPADRLAFLDGVRSGPQGVSLAEVGSLADQAKLPYRLVHRAAGEAIPVPSVIHWKVNHFAAIVSAHGGRYQVEDPTFGRTLWVSGQAIDAEASGYFLVPTPQSASPGSLPWRQVDAAEAGTVRGMGYTNSNDPNALTPDDPCACGGSSSNNGMTGYNFKEMLVSLQLSDTPVGYVPPKGPPLKVSVIYNQREAGQPANFSFFNVSPKWTLNWLTYIQDDPANPGSNVTRVVAGGGEVDYTGYNSGTGAFTPEVDDFSVLSLSTSGGVTYTRTLQDGSREVYSASNGATTYPRLVFLTRITDPYGNSASLTYDSQQRLTSIVDATGRSTTFGYTNTSFPLLVTTITDPFKRSATLGYDSSGRLTSITDVLGLKSQYAYDSSSLVNTLTTPYGTTSFVYGDNGNSRFLQATDPLGYTERLEYVQGASGIAFSDPGNTVPVGIVAPFNQYLNERDTFYWNKHAYAVAAGDYTKARNRHWAHLASNTNVTSNAIESVKYPLEGRIWYNYPGQPTNGLGAGQSGTLNQPTNIGRVLDNGATQLTQYQYNGLGNVTGIVDPVGRSTQVNYATNQVDVTTVQQTTASGPATVAAFTYNAAHQPLTYVDAAGKTTKYAYNTAGQLTRVVNALGQATTYNYNALGYLGNVVNANGKIDTSFTYDAFGRVATRTDSEGWIVKFAYDSLDRLTKAVYPDGTSHVFTYNLLDMVSQTDRLRRVTKVGYDALRRPISITDPGGHVTQIGHYEDGTLKSLTDPNGNVTNFVVDIESRIYAKQYADGTYTGYGYEGTTSRLLFVSDALNQIKQFSYTADDQLAGITYYNTVNPTSGVAFTYDPYFKRVTSMTDGSGTTQYTYQPVGALGALEPAGEQPPYGNSAIGYTYDALGRLATRSVGGNSESVGYDTIGRIASHTDDLGSFTRTYVGQTQQLAGQSNGHVGTTWTYDTNTNDRRLIGVANTPAASSYTFTDNAENDISAIADAFNSQTLSLVYDTSDRLLTSTSSAGPKYSYRYDAADNLNVITRPAGTTTVTPNALNQVASAGTVAYAYDANGNLLNDGQRSYQWDADNRLISIRYKNNPNTVSSFRYDGMGRRIAIGATNGGVYGETRYGWCGQTLCQSRDGSDTVLRHYYTEGEETPAQNMQLYYGVDQLGSVHDALAATTGTSVAHYDYEPYGQPTGTQQATATDFRFAGLFDHQQSGLFLGNYRAYDPVVGRWLSRDPIQEGGGGNLYDYAYDNSVIYSDPQGEFAWILAGGVVGAVINVGATVISNGGFQGLTAQQLAGAAAGGFVAGALGAAAGPLGGTIALELGLGTSSGLAAVGATAVLSAGAGAIGQEVTNVIDPCHASSVANAALWGGIGGGIGKFFPTKNLNSWPQARYFGASTIPGLFRSSNAWWNNGATLVSGGVGAAANFIPSPFPQGF